MKSTLKIVVLVAVLQLSLQAGFECSVSGCELCTAPNVCGQCNPNWLLMQNSTSGAFYCQKVTCASNCMTCYENNTCQMCNSDFYLTSSGLCSSNQTSSSSLPPYCAWGSGSESCSRCNYGYTLQDGFCYPTIVKTYRDQNCMVKMTPSMCQICKTGYIVSPIGQCVSTQVNETCSASNCMYCVNANNTCTKCNSGYQLTSSETCEALPCSITGCTQCASSSECQTCGDGYWLNSTSKSCVAASYGCTVKWCQACDASSQSCSLCNLGYELASFNVKGNMVNMCRKIVCPYNVTNCDACTPHYNEVMMYNQILCAPNSCKTGYIHVNGYCVTNVSTSAFACTVSNCASCSYDNFCSVCNAGYTLSSWGTCAKTTCNVPNCASCSINNICSACDSGYSLTGNLSLVEPSSTYLFAVALQYQCRKSPSFSCNVSYCSYCTSNNVCAACMPGYDFDSTNSNCSVANCNVTNCYECNEGQDKTCSVCTPGYELSSDMLSCTQIAAQCDDCSNSSASNCLWNWAQNMSECTLCNTGYTLYAGKCYAETCSLYGCEVCAGWRDTVTCVQCKQGLLMDYGYCLKLNCDVENCANCVGNQKCLGCSDGYLLKEVNSTTNQCVAESTISNCGVDNCLECSSTKGNMWCATCAAPYMVNSADGSCVCKWQNCLECSFSSLACSNCAPNLLATIKEPNCIPHPSLKLTCSVDNCEYCLTPSQCSVCAQGYSLVSSNLTCKLNDCSALGQDNCLICDQYGYECHLCDTGYQLGNFLEGGSCYQVSNNYTCDLEGCAVCSSSNNSQCASCLSYYSLNNGTCTPYTCNIDNCFLCLEENFCTVCSAGFYLNTDLTCQAIAPGVLTSCTSNIAFCNMCTLNVSANTEKCVQCMEGFEYDSSAVACVPQTNTIENCKYQVAGFFNSLPVCVICTQGYYINSWGTCSLYAPQLANTGCSVYNCLHCASNSSSCSFCFQPWGISDSGQCQTNNTAICADSNCQMCSNSSYCYTCVSAYRPYLGACLQCNVNGCDYCKTANKCSSCMDNYQLLGNGYCLSCDIDNCVSCSDNDVCQQCSNSTGTTLYVSADRTACVECSTANCAFCSSNNNCGVCDNGYQLWPLTASATQTQTCITCNVENCVTCNSNNNCLTCAQGYSAISNGSCIMCSTPCATCNSDGSCKTCQTPFYALNPNSSGKCFVSTVRFCSTYNSSNTNQCTACSSPYTLSSNSCIRSCPESCTACDSTNSSICSSCADGYMLDSSKSCVACSDSGCSDCSSSQTSCSQCFAGYYLMNSECKKCPRYCKTCTSATSCSALSSDQTSSTLFTQSDGSTSLAVCAQGCVSCSNANPQICTQCADGLYLNNGVCVKCANTCRTCSSTNSSQCLSCYRNSFLSGTNCITCNSNCLTCQSANNPDVCTSCRQGSFVSNNKCVTGCPKNCVSCSDADTCTSCLSGYTLFTQSSSTICAQCISSCRTCAQGQPGNCLSCGDGFYLSGSSCVACTSNCQTCSALGCSACSSGYFLTSSQTCSVNCNLPCATCSSTNPSRCSSCITGYSYSSTSFTCNQILTCDGACSVCPLGYALSEGACTECTTSNCQLCSASTPDTCQSCLSGYYLSSSNQCLSCSSSCATCLESDTCTSCASGFTTTETSTTGTNGFLCSACESPCATCSGSTTGCTSCVSGFTFNGWRCVQNFHFFFSITLQTSMTNFNTNYFSFILALANALSSSSSQDSIVIFSIASGSVVTSGAVQPTATSGTKDANSQYSSVDATLANNNDIAGMKIVDSSVTVVGGSVDFDDVDLALILGICIPVGILLIVGIALFIYCKKKKSSDILEQKIKEDSGFTVRESFELSNQYRNDDTARGFQQSTAIN